MDIRYWFKQEENKKEDKKDLINQSMKKQLQDLYKNLLSKLVNNQWIDIMEYSEMINYMKSGGTLVNLGRYFQIKKRIDENQDIDVEVKRRFDKCNKELYSHIYEIFEIDKIKTIKEIKTDKILVDIEKYNKNEIKFTMDQKNAIKKVCNFLYHPKKKTFGLYGYAGTGKTTLITKLIHYLVLKNYLSSIVFAAPTNKAVNILKAKFKDDILNLIKNKDENIDDKMTFDEQIDKLDKKGFKINFLTIHKLLNYKNDFNVNGERIFIKGNKSMVKNYDLVIIDECSMIPMQVVQHIYDDLRSSPLMTSKEETIKRIPKILFVGDPAQLPPVNEKVSIIFSKRQNEFNFEIFKKCFDHQNDDNINKIISKSAENKMLLDKYKEFQNDIIKQHSITLKHIVRNGNNNVIGLCNNIRDWVMGSVKSPILFKYQSEVVLYYKCKNEDKTESKWFKKCLEEFKNQDNNLSNIILTWTNKQSDIYNNRIRSVLFHNIKRRLKKYEVGDMLILNDFYNMEDSDGKNQYEMNVSKTTDNKKFYTSEQIKITDVQDIIKVIVPLNEILNKKIKIKGIRNIESIYINTIKTINNKINRHYRTWKIYVHKLADILVKDTIPELYQLYVLHDNEIERFKKDKEFGMKKIQELRDQYNSMYFENRENIEKNIIRPLWKEWNKKMIEPFANVDHGYCITTHKSQGSTFYNVFVDANDILKNSNTNEAKRCMYTALTRTSNKIHVLI